MNSKLQSRRATHLLTVARSLELAAKDENDNLITLGMTGACAVAIVGWLQAAIREKIERTLDAFSDDWAGLSRVQKAMIVGHICTELKQHIEEVDGQRFPDVKLLDNFADRVGKAISALRKPKQLSPKSSVFIAGDILRSNGTNDLVKIVEAIGGNKLSFKDWLGKTHRQRSQIVDEIDSLLVLRHDFAHGVGVRNATVREVRVYMVRVRQLLKYVDQYIESGKA